MNDYIDTFPVFDIIGSWQVFKIVKVPFFHKCIKCIFYSFSRQCIFYQANVFSENPYKIFSSQLMGSRREAFTVRSIDSTINSCIIELKFIGQPYFQVPVFMGLQWEIISADKKISGSQANIINQNLSSLCEETNFAMLSFAISSLV